MPREEEVHDPVLDAMGEASARTQDAKLTSEAWGAVEALTTALDRERDNGRFGYIRDRDELAKTLRRLGAWMTKNPPPPPADDDDEEEG